MRAAIFSEPGIRYPQFPSNITVKKRNDEKSALASQYPLYLFTISPPNPLYVFLYSFICPSFLDSFTFYVSLYSISILESLLLPHLLSLPSHLYFLSYSSQTFYTCPFILHFILPFQTHLLFTFPFTLSLFQILYSFLTYSLLFPQYYLPQHS